MSTGWSHAGRLLKCSTPPATCHEPCEGCAKNWGLWVAVTHAAAATCFITAIAMPLLIVLAALPSSPTIPMSTCLPPHPANIILIMTRPGVAMLLIRTIIIVRTAALFLLLVVIAIARPISGKSSSPSSSSKPSPRSARPPQRSRCDAERRGLDDRVGHAAKDWRKSEGGGEGRNERGSGQELHVGTRVSALLLDRVASHTGAVQGITGHTAYAEHAAHVRTALTRWRVAQS